jgi:hypothetical protein
VTEIYLDAETQRLSSEVQGGWNNNGPSALPSP